jgi:hypothetical protein
MRPCRASAFILAIRRQGAAGVMPEVFGRFLGDVGVVRRGQDPPSLD